MCSCYLVCCHCDNLWSQEYLRLGKCVWSCCIKVRWVCSEKNGHCFGLHERSAVHSLICYLFQLFFPTTGVCLHCISFKQGFLSHVLAFYGYLGVLSRYAWVVEPPFQLNGHTIFSWVILKDTIIFKATDYVGTIWGQVIFVGGCYLRVGTINFNVQWKILLWRYVDWVEIFNVVKHSY